MSFICVYEIMRNQIGTKLMEILEFKKHSHAGKLFKIGIYNLRLFQK